MNRLRNRLILIFLAATLAPLAATVWVTTSLLDISLEYSSTDELDAISKSLRATANEFYRRAKVDLKQRAASGEIALQRSRESAVHVPERFRAVAPSAALRFEDSLRTALIAMRP